MYCHISKQIADYAYSFDDIALEKHVVELFDEGKTVVNGTVVTLDDIDDELSEDEQTEQAQEIIGELL